MKSKFIKWTLAIAFLLLGILLSVYLIYGGGKEYPDISTTAVYGKEDLEKVLSFQEPIGNVAASKDSTLPERVFFTIHPESRPDSNKLMEIQNGKATPYPSRTFQDSFNTILGVFTDEHHRLWVIDHGNHGFDDVKLQAFDLRTDQLVHEYIFPSDIAPKLSFFNDLSVSPDGKYIVVANVSFFGKDPSIAIYDLESGRSMNRLIDHPSVKDQGYVPHPPQKKMRFFGGLVDLLTGVDGIDFSRDGQYVYYAAMGHEALYRIPTQDLFHFSLSENELSTKVEKVANKPLSDGIRTDHQGNVYITDIEHRGIYLVPPSGQGYTLIKDDRIQWADGLSLSGHNNFYLADSDIPNQMLQSKAHIAAHAPYHIFKFKAINHE